MNQKIRKPIHELIRERDIKTFFLITKNFGLHYWRPGKMIIYTSDGKYDMFIDDIALDLL